MLARDVNSNPTQYRTWIVANNPDLGAKFYYGYKSGNNPFVDVSAYAINDPAVIADFDLPLPANWNPIPSELINDYPIYKVLPATCEDSHLAIIDGYAYMFGGNITSHIYRASLNNPADWIDTGATLPSALYGAALAIVDGYIYLFGGNNGQMDTPSFAAVNTIYSAPVSNPLDWSDTGATLPRKLQYSHLGMYDGNLYLFGGHEVGASSTVILTASTSAPTLWTVAPGSLPIPLYGSCFAQIDGYWMLFGGNVTPDTPSAAIFSAPVTDPTTWSFDGYLPYRTSFSQFVTMGNDGYIIGPMDLFLSTFVSSASFGVTLPQPTINVQSTNGFPSSGSFNITTTTGTTIVNYTGITLTSFTGCTGGTGRLFTPNNFSHRVSQISFISNGFTPIIQCHLNDPSVWFDTKQYVRGQISHSNSAIIYDRIWLFGGSGETAVFACNQQLKYPFYYPAVQAYGQITRVLFPGTDNLDNPYQALCFPYWKTDYSMSPPPTPPPVPPPPPPPLFPLPPTVPRPPYI